MILEYTPEEKAQRKKIYTEAFLKLKTIYAKLSKSIPGSAESDELHGLLLDENQKLQTNLVEFNDAISKTRINAIYAKGGRQALIDSGIEQTKKIINYAITKAKEQREMLKNSPISNSRNDYKKTIVVFTPETLDDTIIIRWDQDKQYMKLRESDIYVYVYNELGPYRAAFREGIKSDKKNNIEGEDKAALLELYNAFKKEIENYPNLITKKLQETIFPSEAKRLSDPVSRNLFSEKSEQIKESGKKGAVIEAKGGKNKGKQLATIRFEKSIETKLDENAILALAAVNGNKTSNPSNLSSYFNTFDDEIHNCCISLYEAGNRIITPKSVFNVLNGKTTNNPSAKTLKNIMDSLDKMLSVLKIEYTDSNGIDRSLKGQLLPGFSSTAETKGKLIEGTIFLYGRPLLLTYADSVNQISTMPIKTYQTGLLLTDSVISLRSYLMTRIDGMKHGSMYLPNRILYSKIYEAAGLSDTASRTEKKRVRENCIGDKAYHENPDPDKNIGKKGLLTEFIENNYIDGFEEYPADAKQKTGIKIDVHIQREIAHKRPLVADKKDANSKKQLKRAK